MTLETKYNRAVEQLELTPEQRERVLKNVAQKRKTNRSKGWTPERILTLAASFVIVLTIAIIFPIMNSGPGVEDGSTPAPAVSSVQPAGTQGQNATPSAGTPAASSTGGTGTRSGGNASRNTSGNASFFAPGVAADTEDEPLLMGVNSVYEEEAEPLVGASFDGFSMDEEGASPIGSTAKTMAEESVEEAVDEEDEEETTEADYITMDPSTLDPDSGAYILTYKD